MAGRGVSGQRTDSLPANLLATALCVLGAGYSPPSGRGHSAGRYQHLWPLIFGIAMRCWQGWR
ncbi:hypothetical protein ACLK19_04100 [Escherichia coli]